MPSVGPGDVEWHAYPSRSTIGHFVSGRTFLVSAKRCDCFRRSGFPPTGVVSLAGERIWNGHLAVDDWFHGRFARLVTRRHSNRVLTQLPHRAARTPRRGDSVPEPCTSNLRNRSRLVSRWNEIRLLARECARRSEERWARSPHDPSLGLTRLVRALLLGERHVHPAPSGAWRRQHLRQRDQRRRGDRRIERDRPTVEQSRRDLVTRDRSGRHARRARRGAGWSPVTP